jgi:molecular chaperone DnaJ
MTRTYYEILGVDEDASQGDVEAAYRERVKETHPDLNDEGDAADRFREVVRAEEVLGDAAERAQYDELGHDAYVSRVDGVNAADTERSPWTTRDESDAWKEPSSEAHAGQATAGGGTTTRTTAGTRAEQSEATREAYRGARHVRDDASDGDVADGYTVHDWEPGTVVDEGYQSELTQERVFLGILVFILYPVFVYSSVSPQFSVLTNVIVSACTLLVLAYLLTMPEVGVIVFGIWSVIAPVGVVVLPMVDLVSAVGVVAILASWVPLGYSVAFARITRP